MHALTMETAMTVARAEKAVGADSKSRYRSARRNADFTIEQNWSSYSAAEHDRWDRLFKRAQGVLENRACDEFIDALHRLELSESGIPDMGRLSERLERIAG